MIDYHTHTLYSDGKNTPEEMVKAAIERGLSAIGFSDHSYTSCDESYCMKKEVLEKYRNEIRDLAARYRGTIDVRLGIEQDYYGDIPAEGYDYIIGSVHYLRFGDTYVAIDHRRDWQEDAVQKFCGGDFYRLTDRYYETVADVVEKTHASIIGHFDVIRKFNRAGDLFDEHDARYVRAVTDALDRLLTYHVPFEINTGGIFRGFQDAPYPSRDAIDYIRARGGSFVSGSDAHTTAAVAFRFDEFCREK